MSALVDHCLELLAPLGAVRAKHMFGGHGVYIDELFVALIAFDRLYLKVDDASRPAFVAAGCEPFVYVKPPRPSPGAPAGKGAPITMSYWTVPAEAMESPALMLPWARQAIAAALRARSARPSAAPRKARATKARGTASTRRRQP